MAQVWYALSWHRRPFTKYLLFPLCILPSSWRLFLLSKMVVYTLQGAGWRKGWSRKQRHLQCSVKRDSWTLPCTPHIGYNWDVWPFTASRKLGSIDMCPAKNSNSGEEMEKRHWGVESPFYNLANDKKGKWRSICHCISSSKEKRFCVSRSWYWFSKWKYPFRREELTT